MVSLEEVLRVDFRFKRILGYRNLQKLKSQESKLFTLQTQL